MKHSSMRCGVGVAITVYGLMNASMVAQEAIPKAKVDPVVITGCVAIGDRPGEYVLSNPKAEAAAPASANSTTSTPAEMAKDGKVMSYPLKGGEMKGHVGHTVAITGTLEDYKPSNSAHQMPGATAAMAADVASSALHVKSVKMIASKCS